MAKITATIDHKTVILSGDLSTAEAEAFVNMRLSGIDSETYLENLVKCDITQLTEVWSNAKSGKA